MYIKVEEKTISRNVIYTDNGIAVKMPSQELSNTLLKK